MNEAKYREAEQRLWDSVGLDPDETFVTLPRLGVKVRVQEVGEGEPVLLIHGGPNAGSTWAPMVEHFDGLRCLLVDRPGTGLSEPYEVGFDNIVGYGSVFVGDVLDGLEIDTAHVVASSFGAVTRDLTTWARSKSALETSTGVRGGLIWIAGPPG